MTWREAKELVLNAVAIVIIMFVLIALVIVADDVIQGWMR